MLIPSSFQERYARLHSIPGIATDEGYDAGYSFRNSNKIYNWMVQKYDQEDI